jgi:hypothetical protein
VTKVNTGTDYHAALVLHLLILLKDSLELKLELLKQDQLLNLELLNLQLLKLNLELEQELEQELELEQEQELEQELELLPLPRNPWNARKNNPRPP